MRIQEFLSGGGGGGGRPDCQKTALTTFYLFSPQPFFTVVYKWFISKRTIIFQGFREGPTFSSGPTFPRGVQLFSRGEGSKC